MTLAQVVYNMSNDMDFANQLYANPEGTLAQRGLKLSKEELAFLLTTRNRKDREKMHIVALAEEKSAAWVM